MRRLRRQRAEQVETIRQAHTAIAGARFQLRGTDSYPDATGTLRLSYGVVQGYEEDGRAVPAMTDFAGLFARAARHGQRPPFDLPPRWRTPPAGFNAAAPLNFVSTSDTVGGNSGSPMVNRAGEFVGILHDGNLPALARSYAYEEQQARSINVHSAGIVAALRGIYGAEALLAELSQGGR